MNKLERVIRQRLGTTANARQFGHSTFQASIDKSIDHIMESIEEEVKVAVTVEGGIVTSVLGNHPIRVLIVDYDTDGEDEERLTEVPPQDGEGRGDDANVFEEKVEILPEQVEALFRIAPRSHHTITRQK